MRPVQCLHQTMKPGDLIEEMRIALQETETGRFAVSSSLADVMTSLLANSGSDTIPLELPWNEVHLGQPVTRHQVVLVGLDDDGARVRFFNPAGDPGHEAGTELGGPMMGPLRRVEEDGTESISVEDFARFFAEGHAYALLRESAS